MCNLPGFGGGGATPAETQLQAQNSELARTLEGHYSTAFADETTTLGLLKSELSQIQSGQQGPGMSAAEMAARTGQIEAVSGAQARNALQAEANQQAGQEFRGASDASGLARLSAIHAQETGETASAAETAKANALYNLTGENYKIGRENALATATGLEALGGQQGRMAESSLQGSLAANKEGFSQAEKIRQQEMEKGSLLGGLLKTGIGLGTSFVTGGLSNLGGADTSFGENVGEFFKGGLGALSGQNG